MKDSTKKIIYTVLIGLPVMLIVWSFSLYFFGCQTNNTCTGYNDAVRTPIPPYPPASLPVAKVGANAADSTPKCKITAVQLIGSWVDAGYPETDPFKFTDSKGTACVGTFTTDIQKIFLTPNLWYDGAASCNTCHNSQLLPAYKSMDLSTYAGILAGSNRADANAKGNDILGAGVWEKALLKGMIFAPDGKTEINRPSMPLGRPATVPAEGPMLSAGTPEEQ
jgi:hypothetical protein